MGLRLPKTKAMLRREAANWLARLHGSAGPGLQRDFKRWRDAHPSHAAAFDRVSRSYEQAGLLKNSPLASSWRLDPAIGGPRWQPRLAIAAVAAIVLLVPAAVAIVHRAAPYRATNAVMLTTGVGEIRQASLADGSQVTLDTATRVEVDIGKSRRSARLKAGRVRFRIASASAPFVVETASSRITAREGVIDVEQGAAKDRIQVIAGAADVRTVDHSATEMALRAGEAAIVGPGSAARTSPASADWTRGMLQFERTPIGDAVTLANRYSERQIIVAGDLSGLRVTGAFRAGDTAGLAKALAAAFRLSLERRDDGKLVLSRSQPPPTVKKEGG